MRAWLRDTAGGLSATYWYLWTGLLINKVGGFAVLFLSLYLTSQRGAGTAQAGLIVGTYGIGGLLGTLAGGVLTDRWGRRRTLLVSHFATVAALCLLAFNTQLAVIAALCALLGVAQSMAAPAFVAAIIDVTPADKRSRAFNLQFWALNLGLAGASLLAGLLAQWSYQALFLIDAGCTLATGVLIAWKVPETLRTLPPPSLSPSRSPLPSPLPSPWPSLVSSSAQKLRRGGGLGTVLTDRIFLVFVGLTLLQALIYTQASTIVPLAMHADGLSPSAYGSVVALGGALIVLGQLFVPRLIDGRRKARVLALALLLNGAGFAVLALADHVALYLTAAVIWTVGSMLAAPPNAEINSELAPLALRGRYQAVFFLTFPAASFLAPSLGGAGLQYLGDAHWLVVGALGAVAAVLHLSAGPSRERRVAAIRSDTAAIANVS
ncbi:MFS transporter [Actinoplanes sp. TRM88002]|uniref:MFS transporter n=1 Tax=Paractinoplanes hotanensis TaxID=2906497 RepID=A0ABT0XTU8_9ACTN|nr:MFS transporter [Actinoplanes hotanensis]MCM4077201.1 MFS transporter [Actinoplanes hotanensis]